MGKEFTIYAGQEDKRAGRVSVNSILVFALSVCLIVSGVFLHFNFVRVNANALAFSHLTLVSSQTYTADASITLERGFVYRFALQGGNGGNAFGDGVFGGVGTAVAGFYDLREAPANRTATFWSGGNGETGKTTASSSSVEPETNAVAGGTNTGGGNFNGRIGASGSVMNFRPVGAPAGTNMRVRAGSGGGGGAASVLRVNDANIAVAGGGGGATSRTERAQDNGGSERIAEGGRGGGGGGIVQGEWGTPSPEPQVYGTSGENGTSFSSLLALTGAPTLNANAGEMIVVKYTAIAPDITATISWNANGGTWWDNTTVNKTNQIVLPSDGGSVTPIAPGTIYRAGHLFFGWNITAVSGNATFTATWSADMTEFEQKISDMERELIELRDKVNNPTTGLVALQGIIADLQDQINNPTTGLLAQLSSANTLAGQRLTTINNLLADIDELEKTITARNTKIGELEGEIDELKTDLATASSERDTNYTEWQKALDEINNPTTGLLKQLADANSTATTNYNNWQTALNEITRLEGLLADDSENASLILQLGEARADRDEYYTNWQTAINDTIPALELARDNAIVNRDYYRGKWEVAINTTIPNLNSIIDGHLDTIGEHIAEIERLGGEHEETIGELNEKISDLERLNGELETANEALQAIIDNDDNMVEIQNLNEEIARLEGEIEATLDDIDELLEQFLVDDLAELAIFVTGLQAQIGALNKIINEMPDYDGDDDKLSIIDSIGFWFGIGGGVMLLISIILFSIRLKKRRDTTKNIFSKL
jgi:predicted  nucleic acid-binding Zn-ribbon protein